MRHLLIAAVVAFTAPLAVGSVAEAATTKIIIKESDRRPARVVEKRRVVRHDARGCTTRKVVTKVRGERIVKTTKVCG
jgi:hypothetical protein